MQVGGAFEVVQGLCSASENTKERMSGDVRDRAQPQDDPAHWCRIAMSLSAG